MPYRWALNLSDKSQTFWSAKLNVSRNMVVDNDVVNSDVEKRLETLATPPGVKLSILPVDKAAANILAENTIANVLIVALNPTVSSVW